MSIDWATEYPRIAAAAAEYAVDPFFVAAIRHAENGGPGIEYGVESAKGGAYAEQLAGACATLRDRLAAYPGNPFILAISVPVRRLWYRRDFIMWFAASWAPRGAANDPENLNENWFGNAMLAYSAAVAAGKVE